MFLQILSIFTVTMELFTCFVTYSFIPITFVIPNVVSYFIIAGTFSQLFSTYFMVFMAIKVRMETINDYLR